MARQRFDIGSKWLLQNQGRGVAIVGGMKDVRRCEPMPSEVVQNRRYPDGLLQAFLGDDPKPRHLLIEIATYPERRALKQALDDISLAYSALGHLPEMLMLVLRPKGRFRIEGHHTLESEQGWTSLGVKWRTVEMWTLSAEQFLAEGDVGVLPWVPLMNAEGSPAPIFERCAERIEREAKPKQLTDMLVVSQVMAELRYPDMNVFEFFGGKEMWFNDSPLVKRMSARVRHEDIIDVLKLRFGSTPRDLTRPLRAIVNEKQLRQLHLLSIQCQDLDAFRTALQEKPTK